MYPRDEGRHPTTGGPHPKFTDYSFDATEFHRIVRKAVDHVKRHPDYVEAKKRRGVSGRGKKIKGAKQEL